MLARCNPLPVLGVTPFHYGFDDEETTFMACVVTPFDVCPAAHTSASRDGDRTQLAMIYNKTWRERGT